MADDKTDESKENFIKALEIMEAEEKFTLLAFGAPLVMFVAKLDTILQIQDACLKLFLSVSFISLIFGLVMTAFSLSHLRTWRAKEVLEMSGDIYRGKKYFSYIESLINKGRIELNEKVATSIAKYTTLCCGILLLVGWSCLLISLLIALWSDNPLTAAQSAATESTVIIHTQEKSDN